MKKEIKKASLEACTPEKALELLCEGNARFINNQKADRDLLQQVYETSKEQHPFAVILSCIDSRTSPELIFDQGIGDIFSIRIAGNIVNEDILGSMELACSVASTKLIVVLGHTRCVAIESACADIKTGNLSGLISKLKPAVESVAGNTGSDHSDNAQFIMKVAETNVRLSIKNIIEKSSILSEKIKNNEIGIVGGNYSVETGVVNFLKGTL